MRALHNPLKGIHRALIPSFPTKNQEVLKTLFPVCELFTVCGAKCLRNLFPATDSQTPKHPSGLGRKKKSVSVRGPLQQKAPFGPFRRLAWHSKKPSAEKRDLNFLQQQCCKN